MTIELVSPRLTWAEGRLRVVRSAEWTVTTWQGDAGLVRAAHTASGLRLTVGDGADHTHVSLLPDGAFTVRTAATPPALLVSASGARTVPEVPGVPECSTLAGTDRLLVLTSSALDALPDSLAAVLAALPESTRRAPADLLRELLEDLPAASGAVVQRETESVTRRRTWA